MKTMTVTQAARNFSDLVNRVHYQGVSVELVKSKRVVAVISPATKISTMKVGDLSNFFSSLPNLGKDSAELVKDMEDIAKNMPKAMDEWE